MSAKISKRFVATYFSAACLVMVFAGLQPGAEGKIAVFASPWSNPAPQIVAAAGGRIVSTDASGWIAVTEADSDGIVGRLYASGAAFVASSVVARACAGFVNVYGESNS
ncbi:hypothetical protein [Roseibium sp.]|uniref:hypothetical protein n=1 Tax=Roseibium sp. TaxID=1936156 RepID=UPI003A96EB18